MSIDTFSSYVSHSYSVDLSHLRSGTYKFFYVRNDEPTGICELRVISENHIKVTELFPMIYSGVQRKSRYGTFCLFATMSFLEKLAQTHNDKPYIEFQFPNEKSQSLMPKIGMKNGFAAPLPKVKTCTYHFLLDAGYAPSTLEKIAERVYAITDASSLLTQRLRKSQQAAKMSQSS